jgi:gamma-glutamyltranspeptidase/glutathione hydrolase
VIAAVKRLLPLLLLLGLVLVLPLGSAEPVRWRNGAVATVSGPATDVGVEVLKKGGNSVDAAVAVALALAVTHPAAGNLGGGGFMVVVPPKEKGEPTCFDFREMAPGGATREMFVKPEGRTPHLRVGVPGTVRGLALAHRRLGKLSWKELAAPAVALARDGFILDEPHARSLNGLLRKDARDSNPELHRVFGQPEGRAWKAGDRMVQPDLARTLQRIAEEGPDAFYKGLIAEQIEAEMKRGGGLITRTDLAGYQAKERKPLQSTYRGHDIVSMPPPSSGGTALIEMLNVLETFDLRKQGRWSPETLHLMTETMKRAYRDRAAYLGDPDFVEVPAMLTTKDYARRLALTIDPKKATPSAQLAGDIQLARESEETTHFSVIDANRLAVSLTYTLEDSFGSRVVVKGAGFLLNDEMNDFNWLPGVTNQAGRIGTPPNQVVPGKRMLSSMTPTIVCRDGKPLLITGSPGGRTIINTVLCVLVNVLDFDMDLRSAVDAPRMHHQWLPDRLRFEPDLPQRQETMAALEKMGHVLDRPGRQGDAHSIWIDPKTGELVGAADRRISGKAAGY